MVFRSVATRFLAASLILTLACESLAVVDDQPPSPDAVQASIKKAQEFLLARQSNGNWEKVQVRDKTAAEWTVTGVQWGGMTALTTYALLASGISPQDARLKTAIEFLEKADLVGTYAIGMRCQVWHLIPQDATVRACEKKDFQTLLKSMHEKGPGKGFYTYWATGKPPASLLDFDHSGSQYAVLGMWACAQDGVEVPSAYWNIQDEAWRKAQQTDGGWSYGKPGPAQDPSTVSMTAAGVASLLIISDQLNYGNVLCNGNRSDSAIERGLDWIGNNFESFPKPVSAHYALYGIERIGVASGRKYLGKTNWYAQGARFFIQSQLPTGAWNGYFEQSANTSLALLFLVRGSAPVVLNKLDYRSENEVKRAADSNTQTEKSASPWNQRPRDASNLVKWMSEQTEEPLNWQVVTLRDQAVDDMHDAPILYISGNQPLHFNPNEEAKLKQFIEEGGLILFNADCGGIAFTDSVKKLATRLFPIPGEFTPVPSDSCIYTDEQYLAKKWKAPQEVLGLNNGVRQLMILLPFSDPAKSWQTGNHLARPEQFQLPADIFLYATDEKDLQLKGATYIIRPDPKIVATKTIKLARLQYPGPWDPEPGGWRRLAAIMHNHNRINLEIQPVKLGEEKLTGYKVAHLTGTVKLVLSEPARTELKKFVQSGGTLIIDAAGGRSEFAGSAQDELQKMFPDAANTGLASPLPPDDPLYTKTGDNIEHFVYRRFAKKLLPAGFNTPRLNGLTVNGRLAVFFSAEDLSGGLVGESIDGINGYDPATSTALMTRMLIYADSPPKP